jgi:hypothetical protein
MATSNIYTYNGTGTDLVFLGTSNYDNTVYFVTYLRYGTTSDEGAPTLLPRIPDNVVIKPSLRISGASKVSDVIFLGRRDLLDPSSASESFLGARFYFCTCSFNYPFYDGTYLIKGTTPEVTVPYGNDFLKINALSQAGFGFGWSHIS